jgi:hypothetical protein
MDAKLKEYLDTLLDKMSHHQFWEAMSFFDREIYEYVGEKIAGIFNIELEYLPSTGCDEYYAFINKISENDFYLGQKLDELLWQPDAHCVDLDFAYSDGKTMEQVTAERLATIYVILSDILEHLKLYY